MLQRADLEAELERLHRESFGWALSCCDWDRAEAEDVIQTTYLKVIDGTARFEGRSSFKTWLFAVIRRTAAERRRRLQVRGVALLRWVRQRPEPEQASTELAAHRADASAELVAALRRLPARQREVLHLVFYQGLSIREAAAIMRVSLGAARQHYERGKQKLRVALGPRFGAEEAAQ
jgi:RNA polymerase sigma-70 factor, ECF subfamily